MMGVLGHILRKELLQLLRTPALAAILLLCPVITVGLVPFGLRNETRLRVAVVDQSYSSLGREAVEKLNGSPHIQGFQALSLPEAERLMDRDEIDAIVVVNDDGRKWTLLASGAHLIVSSDAANYIVRQLSSGLEDASIRVHRKYAGGRGNGNFYIVTMLVLLIAIIGCFLAALSVINEKESKVLEHLRSTGMRPGLYVGSKLLFFLLVGLAELTVGLLITRVVFHFRVAGSLLDVYILASCFLLAMVGLGIFVSASSHSLIQGVYVLVFLFFILVLLSTMFAPLDNMSPLWATTRFANPFFWMADGSWRIMLKGFTLADCSLHLAMLLLEGALLYGLNVWKIKNLY